MDIDLAALRALERERDISLDVLVPAIEQALLLAYQRTDGAYRHSRAELDRKTGHVVIWAREEFEVQRAVLMRTREKLEALERAVAALEAERAGTPPTASN